MAGTRKPDDKDPQRKRQPKRKPNPKRKQDVAMSQLPFFMAGASERKARRAARQEGTDTPRRRRQLLTPEQEAVKEHTIYQCSRCHSVKHPPFTPNPGHRLTPTETGKDVSHGLCPGCRDALDEQNAQSVGMTRSEYRRKSRAAFKRFQRQQEEKKRRDEEGEDE